MTTIQTAMLPTKLIACYRSGVPLASVTAVCSQGWPLLTSFQAALLHPIYQMPLSKLVLKLRDHLDVAETTEWSLTEHELSEIKLCMSAIMYDLNAIWQAPQDSKQHIASLPTTPVAVGSAARLLSLASWYHFITSKRLSFPQYRVSPHNNNLGWENFSAWLDDAFEIKTDWESVKSRHEQAEEFKRREAAIQTIKAESIYKRIDFNKVWNWIDIQLADHAEYPLGRRATLKELFMRGDLAPEDWCADDVDDLVEAVLSCCDCGNEITHFINTRLNHIRQIINDFYGSFTLLSTVASDGKLAHPDAVHTEQEKLFFSEIDNKLDALSAVPPAPKRESFASTPLFLKAQAQHRLLVRRHSLRAEQSNQANTNNI